MGAVKTIVPEITFQAWLLYTVVSVAAARVAAAHGAN